MKVNMLRATFFSITTCIALVSLQGCGSDRAGITASEADSLSNNSLPGTRSVNCGQGTDDTDCDYIPDAEEASNRTLLNNPDTDGDGIIDGCEAGYITTNDACGKTDPTKKDTDNDGIDDNIEVFPYDTPFGMRQTDPRNADSDGDGLSDGDEIGDITGKGLNNNLVDKSSYITDPKDKDTDDDRLSDGYEALTSGISPLKADSDGDGVTDGIEVCGTTSTNQDLNGKIISTVGNIDPDNSTNFYDDILNLTNDNSINKDGNDSRCQTPYDYNGDGTIDASDAENDSDGDWRPNNKEKERGTDPLHAGKDSNLTVRTADVNSSIDDKYYYPWITQTTEGKKMVDAGFVYIPKSLHNENKYGFWMAKYEAREDSSDSSKVVFNTTSGNIVQSLTRDEASSKISSSQVSDGFAIYLPTKAQYDYLPTVKSDYLSGCMTVENTSAINDPNMPIGAKAKVCELSNTTNKEFVKDDDSFDYFDGTNNHYLDNSDSGQGVGFRATSDYLPETH